MGTTTRHGVPLLVGNAIADFQQIDDSLNHFDGTAALQSDLLGHEAATSAHGATGAVVGTTNTQTLTNKSLTAPVITGTVTGGASYTAPTITGPTITGTVAGGAIYTAPHLTSPVVDSGGLVITAGGATITGGVGLGVIIGGGFSHPGLLFFPNGAGEKIVFEADSVSTGYGIGLNTSELCLFTGVGAETTIRQGSLSGSVSMRLSATGAMTIGGLLTQSGSWRKLKTQIKALRADDQSALLDWLVNDFAPVRYRFKDEVGVEQHHHLGFVLDDLPASVREIVTANAEGGIVSRDVEGLLMVLVQETNRRLGARISALEAR